MAEEIKITYESLFDLLRRERNREDLQKLDETFYQDVLIYLEEKKSLITTTNSSDYTISAESEKTRIQFYNIKRILKELYDRREKKIIMLAVNAVRTGAMHIDKSSFLPEEQHLYEDITMHCRRYRRDVIERVLQEVAPVPMSPIITTKPKKIEKILPVKESTPQKEEPKKIFTGKIKFLKAVPRFSGGEDKVFGPYIPGDTAELPPKIASVLVKKGRAEEV